MSARRSDDGFMLLEVIVGLIIVTIVMTALTTVFVHGIQSTSRQRATQAAIRLVTDQADALRALPPKVLAERSTPRTVTVNGTDYQLSTKVNDCYQPIVSSGTDTCQSLDTPPPGATRITSKRITISASWDETSCGPDACTYTDSIVVNESRDPTFPFNDAPPPPPEPVTCLNQTVTIGQVIKMNLGDKEQACAVTGGVVPFTWVLKGLPVGLKMETDGTISGTVEGPVGVIASTAGVTDAFLRKGPDADFTWAVATDFQVRNLWLRPNQGKPISVPLNNFVSGGVQGAQYKIISGTLPDGLSLDGKTGIISGKGGEATVGDYPLTIAAIDSAGHSVGSTVTYYVRDEKSNQLLLCPEKPLPYDPPIKVSPDPPPCAIPGSSSGNAEFPVGKPIPPFNLWDNTFGGTSPYRFEVSVDQDWIHVDPNTGVVSGTPTKATGPLPFKVRFQVSGSDGPPASITVPWQVIP